MYVINKTFISFLYSVNKINTLAPFENCVNLQELYLRKNNINDINELVYLQVNILHRPTKIFLK